MVLTTKKRIKKAELELKNLRAKKEIRDLGRKKEIKLKVLKAEIREEKFGGIFSGARTVGRGLIKLGRGVGKAAVRAGENIETEQRRQRAIEKRVLKKKL